jgi:hypothetical protein
MPSGGARMEINDLPKTNFTDELPAGQVRSARIAWSRPFLRRFSMSEAEIVLGVIPDHSESLS